MDLTFKYLLKSVLLPPGLFLLLFLAGALFGIYRPRLGVLFKSLSLLLLFTLSAPQCSHILISTLEKPYKPLSKSQQKKKKMSGKAIVVLTGGQIHNAQEYGRQSFVSTSTLVRVAYASYLHKKNKVPILISGGSFSKELPSEAKSAEEILAKDFGVSVKWLDEDSQNTLESAQNVHLLLKKESISKIFLVTEAWHMRRAALAFSSVDLEVIPAPTFFQDSLTPALKTFLPDRRSLMLSGQALHEWLGYCWYKMILSE